jgi:hypothetical protein
MDLFFTIVITVLVVLGAFTLLDWLADKTRMMPATVNRERRLILSLFASIAAGSLTGVYVWYENRRAQQTLRNLFELELLLAQLEGLVGAALAQEDQTRILPSIEAVVDKIGDYGSRTIGLVPQIETQIPPRDFDDLNLGTSMIISGLAAAKATKAFDHRVEKEGNPFTTIQRGVSIARKKTRELINERLPN